MSAWQTRGLPCYLSIPLICLINPRIHLSFFLSIDIYLSIRLPICLSIYLVCLSFYLSFCLSSFLSVFLLFLPVYLSISLYLSIYLSICPPGLSIYLLWTTSRLTWPIFLGPRRACAGISLPRLIDHLQTEGVPLPKAEHVGFRPDRKKYKTVPKITKHP